MPPFDRRGIFRNAGSPRGEVGRAVAVAVATDPDFASVVLLLDFAGADGATDITDLSDSAHTDTFVGTAQVDSDLQVLSTNSVLLDGNSDYVSYPDHADWDFGTGDFTVELHVRFSAVASTYGLISSRNGSVGWQIQFQAAGTNLNFLIGSTTLKSEDWAPSVDTWYHVAVSRSGTNLRMFVDGTELATATTDSTDFTGGTGAVVIGVARGVSPVQYFGGNLAAVRITKGVARYTAGFTAPTEMYPTS